MYTCPPTPLQNQWLIGVYGFIAKLAPNCSNRLYSLNVDGPEFTFSPLYILVHTNNIHLSAPAPRWILVLIPELMTSALLYISSHPMLDK